MANNYSVTSYTLRDAHGHPAVLGPISSLLFTRLPGESTYYPDSATGVYDDTCDADEILYLLTDKLSADDNFDADRGLVDSLKALGATEAMLEVAAGWDTIGCLRITDLYDLAVKEPGATLYSLAMETGWWCDKNRVGEFGGYGCYVSPVVAVEESSPSAVRIGADMDEALGLDETGTRAAGILKRDVLDPILLSMEEDRRCFVIQALKELL